MSVPVLTFFNNKGGVGKTSLIYHLAWMYALLGKRVVVADLDPQANLTAAFLNEDEINTLWERSESGSTIYQCVRPLTGVGDLVTPRLQTITQNLFLVAGDVALSSYEDVLASQWGESMADNNLYRPLRILTSFWHVMQNAASQINADIILVDIGPNLGAINRSVLLATDYVVIPLGADLFSLQGLKNLGPALKNWRSAWKKRLENWKESSDFQEYTDFTLPQGIMQPVGYLSQQHGVRLDRPVKAYDRWINKIPSVYREVVLNETTASSNITVNDDPYSLGTIKHYRSLIPMAQESRKPIFNLTAADGAIGSHANAVLGAKKDFEALAESIASKISLR